MPNLLNIAINKEYETLLGQSQDMLFVQPLGMTVADVTAFRNKLAEQHLRMRVVKGSLARRVLEARGLSNLGPLFEGSAALITAADGQSVDCVAIAASKAVHAWKKPVGKADPKPLPVIKGALLDGVLLGAQDAIRLQAMPGRAELMSRISAQITAPGRRLAGQVIASGGRLAGALTARINSLEKQATTA